MQGIIGSEEQDAAALRHGEAAQAWDGGSDRDGDVEGEGLLAAFGLAADDADGLLGTQAVDQPALLLGALGETPRRLDRQQAHRRGSAALASVTGGAQVSRNSF